MKWAIPLRNEPYLINVLIDIFLSFGALPAEEDIYNGQASLSNANFSTKWLKNALQMMIAFVSIIAIFVMLLPKPIILLIMDKRKKAQKAAAGVELEAAVPEEEHHEGGEHVEVYKKKKFVLTPLGICI